MANTQFEQGALDSMVLAKEYADHAIKEYMANRKVTAELTATLLDTINEVNSALAILEVVYEK